MVAGNASACWVTGPAVVLPLAVDPALQACLLEVTGQVRRFDHVGITVADLDAVTAFFVGLGLEGLPEPDARGYRTSSKAPRAMASNPSVADGDSAVAGSLSIATTTKVWPLLLVAR